MARAAGRGAATWHMRLQRGGDDEVHAAERGGGDVASATGRGRASWSTGSARAQQSQLGKGNKITHLMLKMPNTKET